MAAVAVTRRVSASVMRNIAKAWRPAARRTSGSPHISQNTLSGNVRSRTDPVAGQKGPLFRSANRRTVVLTRKRMHRVDAWRMVQRRAPAAGLIVHVGSHSFRATGITAYLNAGGTLGLG